MLEERYELSNGVQLPKLGLGTWFINNRNAVQAVRDAADIGYRHIDTAQAYRNEAGVGQGVRSSGVPRDEFFVTTKLAANMKSYEKASAAIDKSLQTLGFDYIDLMIIHSPQPWMRFGGKNRFFDGNRAAWHALEAAYEAGKLRAIGLSNFQTVDIDNILESCSVRPMVNQILAHIGNTPKDLVEYSQANGMLVEAYSPIAHGQLLENRDIEEMAARYGVSVPQLSVRYVLQLGLVALPKTANPAHMRSNADVDFVISDEDMSVLLNADRIEYSGAVGLMPVYGGTLSPKTLVSTVIRSIRSR